jgi:cell division protein FtsQ
MSKQSGQVIGTNMNLKRRIRFYQDRFIYASKIIIVIALWALFFTDHFTWARNLFKNILYEYSSEAGLNLGKVVISGRRNLASEEILTALSADVGTPILSIDLDKTQSLLQKNPWVQEVAIYRSLPDTIQISITEKIPVAIWQTANKLYIIDEKGSVLGNDKIMDFAHLPHVVGVNANIHANNLVKTLDINKEFAKKMLHAVRYGDRRWNLILEEGITVKMPEDKYFNEAFKYLLKIFSENKLFNQNFKHIDLRNQDKYFFEKNTYSKPRQ